MIGHSSFSNTKRAFIFLSLIISLNSVCFAITGSGTEADPYRIGSFEDFQEFAGNSSYWASGAHTMLDCDIDLDQMPERLVPMCAIPTTA